MHGFVLIGEKKKEKKIKKERGGHRDGGIMMDDDGMDADDVDGQAVVFEAALRAATFPAPFQGFKYLTVHRLSFMGGRRD